MRVFKRTGLPNRRVEEWKYTDLYARLDEAFAPLTGGAPNLTRDDVLQALGGELGTLDCHLIVLVDGQVAHDLSELDFLGERGELMSMAAALAAPPAWLEERLADVEMVPQNAVLCLNTALMSDGVALRVAADVSIEKPIHIVHLHTATTPIGIATRHVVTLEEGARASVLESHVGPSSAVAQHNVASDVSLAKGAAMHHLKIQRETDAATHLSTWRVALAASANYDAFQFVGGTGLTRNEIHLGVNGEQACAGVNGVFMGASEQHIDTTLFVDHAAANCVSRMVFKGVLDDAARGVFQGKIMVRQQAQKTDSNEMAQGLLLSERAEFDSKPELEIFADDVVCGHGSTSGQIDEDLLFYLRARGIGELEARSLLIQAFAGEALELIENETIREALSEAVRGWLAQRIG
jgi:Fe-S cluster assembly protein SufD